MEIPEGWTAYNGEGQPVDDDEMVMVILCGDKRIFDETSLAHEMDWEHTQGPDGCDIIAYKVVE